MAGVGRPKPTAPVCPTLHGFLIVVHRRRHHRSAVLFDLRSSVPSGSDSAGYHAGLGRAPQGDRTKAHSSRSSEPRNIARR